MGIFCLSVSLACLTSLWWPLFYPIIIYFVLFCCYLPEAGPLLMKDRKVVDPDGRGGREKLGGVEGGKLYLDYIV